MPCKSQSYVTLSSAVLNLRVALIASRCDAVSDEQCQRHTADKTHSSDVHTQLGSAETDHREEAHSSGTHNQLGSAEATDREEAHVHTLQLSRHRERRFGEAANVVKSVQEAAVGNLRTEACSLPHHDTHEA